MKRIRWTQAAAADLQSIVDYLQEHQPAFAQPTAEKLYTTVQSLKRMPLRGRVGQLTGTRELPTTPLPYIIVYELDEETVYISRILHGAQSWPGRTS